MNNKCIYTILHLMPKRNGYLGIFGDLVKNLRHFRRIWPEIP